MIRSTFPATTAVLLGLLLSSRTAPAAAPNFFDDFENQVGGDIVWTPWNGQPGTSTTPIGLENLVTTSDNQHNHTPGGFRSARVFESQPAHWNGYSDFGATPDSITATAWVWDDVDDFGAPIPGFPPASVTAGLSLFGNSTDPTPNPNDLTDYLQLVVLHSLPGASIRWSIRTRYNEANGLGAIDTNIAREQGWTKLIIQADSLAAGGAVRFYLQTPSMPSEQLVGSSFRAGATGGLGGLSPVDLRWVRIGNNDYSYDNFWYDDVSVVPEPASLGVLGFAAIMLRARRRSGRNASRQ